MKKILRLTSSVLVGTMCFFNLQAQQQPLNGGFENWDNIGTDDREPTNWNSFRTADCSLTFGCGSATARRLERETDTRPGSTGDYSVRIFSTEVLGITANGNLTTGKINIGSTTASSPNNHNYTRRENADFNMPFSQRPDSIAVWVKFNAADAASMARIAATVHGDYNYRDPQDVNSEPFAVGKAILNYPRTNGQWQRLSFPFDYDYPSNDPQYVLITFTTNMIPGGGAAGDEVYIDDLEFIYNPNTVTIAPDPIQYLLVDEAGTLLEATETPNAESAAGTISREWKYSTTSGSGYVSFASAETGTTYTPQFNAIGTYYVVCETNFDGEILTSNEVTIIVSETIPNVVQIAPTTTQNISVSTDGTTLNATETPDAGTSREWKYTTTSGSGYMSFISDEFALTYTPNFATAGTYYVVCVSEINGETVTSNEVQINVTDGTSSLGELTQEHIVIYQTESNLVVDLSNASVNDVDMNLYNMDGRLVHSSKLSNNGQNIIQIDFPVGIYVMTLSTDKGVYQQKVYVK